MVPERFLAEIPSSDFFFQKVQKMKNDRTRSQEPDWEKLRPGPFTEHIRHSRQDRDSVVGCKGLSNEGQCLLFPSGLTGAALNWFYRLEPETVDSFDEEAYDAFKSGLRSSHFWYLVHSSNWRTYDELMKQAVIYAKVEYFNSKSGPSARQEEPALKNYSAQKQPYTPIEKTNGYPASQKRKDNSDARQGHLKKGKGKYGRNDHRAPLLNHDRSHEVFTLLNTTYEANLMNKQEIIPKLVNRKPNRQDNRDTEKFYLYHQHNNHNTEECISLRKIVEHLIWEGKLDQYIARPPQAPAPNVNR
ncbi:unnamed protein product [Prunus armeniaca]